MMFLIVRVLNCRPLLVRAGIDHRLGQGSRTGRSARGAEQMLDAARACFESVATVMDGGASLDRSC
jgi:hypothetical protein